MAVLTNTVALKSVFGNTRVEILNIDTTAASGYVSWFGSTVYAATFSPLSMTTDNIIVQINKLDAGTAAAGQVTLKGLASGDNLFLTIYGKS